MDENLKARFAKNLREQLEKNHKTQRDMCDYMGVSSATGSDWCNGKKMPRTDKIQSLSNWLGCSLSDLLEGSHYVDDTVKEMTSELLQERPDLQGLLEASRKLTPEDVEHFTAIINGIANGNYRE